MIADASEGRRRADRHVARAHRDRRPATVRQSFGFATQLRQTLSIASSSFWMIAKSLAGLFLLVVFPMFVVLVLMIELQTLGRPTAAADVVTSCPST